MEVTLPDGVVKDESEHIKGKEEFASAKMVDDVARFYHQQVTSAEADDEEITNNDGSVKETFDTAFHGTPGDILEHSVAGSNRAEFYEARSQGQSDVDEETEYLKSQQEKSKE